MKNHGIEIVRTQRVKLSDLKLNLFVRKELDIDRAILLAQYIENGTKMTDNIVATNDLRVVDGRTRHEAYDLCKVEEVDVDICNLSDEVEIIAAAYRANNPEGSKPPTAQDTDHTVESLLERKQSIKAIAKHLALPESVARKYVGEVKSRLTRAKIFSSVDAVTNGGLTVAQAAEKYDVDPEKLKEALSGTRKKHKQSKHGVEELQRKITFTYKSVGSTNGSALKKLLEKYEDNDVNAEQVREVLKHLKDCQKKSARAVADWERRFEAKANGTEQTEESAA